MKKEGMSFESRMFCSIILAQWFPKWAVPPPWGRWETLGGRWSRNTTLSCGRYKAPRNII